jgi:CTP synthase
MQVMVVEAARTALGTDAVNSTEFDPETPHPVISLLSEQEGVEDKGGTMRLGAYPCHLTPGSRAQQAYGTEDVRERHRHRYEFNNTYTDQLAEAGLIFSGFSRDGLVELIELPAARHPWFFATQFHPEFTSNPRDGHPLFTSFITAARSCQGLKLPRVASA